MREKILRFMSGRYGFDFLGRCTFISALVLMAIALFADSSILSVLAWLFVVLAYYRMFSRNIYKRAAENQKFLNKTYKMRCWFGKQKNIAAQRKIYHIYKCPACRQKIRIPRGKGKIEVQCPKCHTAFIKNS